MHMEVEQAGSQVRRDELSSVVSVSPLLLRGGGCGGRPLGSGEVRPNNVDAQSVCGSSKRTTPGSSSPRLKREEDFFSSTQAPTDVRTLRRQTVHITVRLMTMAQEDEKIN